MRSCGLGGSVDLRACLIGLILLMPPGSVAAQPECPSGNLLAGKLPVTGQGVSRIEVLTDDEQPSEGAFWDSEHTAIFVSESSFIVYDLGVLTLLDALHFQADNNDTFGISISKDGEHFEPLFDLPSMAEAGMQTRTVREIGRPARFIRVGEARGDGYFSVGEIQAYCVAPDPWPPAVALTGPPAASPTTGVKAQGWERWWSNREVRLSVHKSVIGILSLLVFLGLMSQRLRETRLGWLVSPASAAAALAYTAYLTWGFWPLLILLPLSAERLLWIYREQGRQDDAKKRRNKKPNNPPKNKRWAATSERGSLLAIMVVGALTWTNFLSFHGVREVHLWDFMHYYVGSKYFEENDFRWLYHCALLAELDDGRADEVMRRKYRSLKDNRLGPARLIVEEAEKNCRANFSDERWRAFQQDLRIFRDLMSPGWFKDAFKDHGYNATPAWTAIGSAISNWGWRDEVPEEDMVFSPANLADKSRFEAAAIERRFRADRDRLYRKVTWLARIDLALYAGIFGMISWAFGLRAGALAIAMWCVGHPWAYFWTGGSFGRTPWLFMSVAGLCAMKMGYGKLAGVGIVWAVLLRAFPGALAGGLALKFGWNALRERRIDRQHRHIIAGAAAGAVFIGALGGLSAGFESYSGFLANSVKHQSTPLTNHMGLRTLVTYDPRYTARHLGSNDEDPYAGWKDKRRELFDERILGFGALLVGAFLLIGALARGRPDWEITSLSTLLIFGIFELTCYYFSFLVILAPFCVRRTRYAVALMAMAIGTQLSALSSDHFDEVFLLDSALILLLFLYVLGGELRRQSRLEST